MWSKRRYAYFRSQPHFFLSQSTRWRRQAQLLGLSHQARHRLEVLLWCTEHGGNLSLASRHFGHPRKVIRRWRARFDGVNLHTLEDRSRRPHHVRSWQVTPLEEHRILTLRRERLHWGKRKLIVLYHERYGEKITTWKVERVIRCHRLYPNPVRAAKLARKRQASWRKRLPGQGRITDFQARQGRLGELIHVDGIVLWWNGIRRVIFTGLDDLTKLAYARMYQTASSRNARDFLRRFLYLLDVPVGNVHSDNGSEFAKEFQSLCQHLAMVQWYNRPRTPTDNPALERFNQTLQREWLDDGHFTLDCGRLNVALTDWLLTYNFERPHQALGYETPIAYAVRKHQLAPMYPART